MHHLRAMEDLIIRPALRVFRCKMGPVRGSARIRLRAHQAYPEPRTGLVRGEEGGRLANGGRERERERGSTADATDSETIICLTT
jgi:hypothetical protein